MASQQLRGWKEKMTEEHSEHTRRKAIPKRTRFEVFKRDSFKCQYCGASAPDVVLQIDHIKPVADGGSNDITNLVTACTKCNSGKSDKPLDENTAVKKRKAQLDELQDRREQLEMLMEWMEGLQDLKDQAVNKLCEYWSELAPGFTPNDRGRQSIKRWLRRYLPQEIMHGMDVAAEQYLDFQNDGTVTKESWEKAFNKVPAICGVVKDSKEGPDLKELFYIRAIVRNKCGSDFDNPACLDWLRAARSYGIPMSDLRQIALGTRGWRHFTEMVQEIIDECEEQQEET
jgi:5-methylcytosine-specific restriction endonuclease McrA